MKLVDLLSNKCGPKLQIYELKNSSVVSFLCTQITNVPIHSQKLFVKKWKISLKMNFKAFRDLKFYTLSQWTLSGTFTSLSTWMLKGNYSIANDFVVKNRYWQGWAKYCKVQIIPFCTNLVWLLMKIWMIKLNLIKLVFWSHKSPLLLKIWFPLCCIYPRFPH